MFPAVLCLEAMAQLMCVLAYASDAIDPNLHMFVFAGIDKAKFRHPITPGDQVVIGVEVLQRALEHLEVRGHGDGRRRRCAPRPSCWQRSRTATIWRALGSRAGALSRPVRPAEPNATRTRARG